MKWVKQAAIGAFRFAPLRMVAEPTARAAFYLGNRINSGLSAASASGVALRGTADVSSVDKLIRIEFLGPSGIGKTTFARALLKNRRIGREFARFGGLRSTRDALRDTHGTWGGPSTRNDEIYMNLMVAKLQRISERHMNAHDRVKLLQFCAGNLLEDVRLSASFPSGIVVRDDGLLHNFGAEILSQVGHSGLVGLLGGRIVVLLRAPIEVIAQRAVERQYAGGLRPQYVGLSLQRAEQVVADSLIELNQKVKFLSAMGVPALELDVSRPDISETLRLAADFVIPAISDQKI